MSDRDLEPATAVERFLSRRKSENTEHTIRSYRYRLKQFVDYCEDEGIQSMGAVDGWVLDEGVCAP